MLSGKNTKKRARSSPETGSAVEQGITYRSRWS
jgi:hypothetical protein